MGLEVIRNFQHLRPPRGLSARFFDPKLHDLKHLAMDPHFKFICYVPEVLNSNG